jgi:PHD/YefM family antitoxin component YafN of YafNO toxin-antitoxin module
METQKVGIREFRDKLATYLLESDRALAITRHGDTIGYYLPARRKRTEAEKEALESAAARLQEVLAAKGITANEIIDDFERMRSEEHK